MTLYFKYELEKEKPDFVHQKT